MKNLIVGVVIGICLIITAGTVWSYVQLNKTVTADHTNLTQVISFLNQQITAAQKATPAPVVTK